MPTRKIKIGLIGCGTVGRGVIQLLRDHAELYEQRTGCQLVLHRVLVRSQSLSRHLDAELVDPEILTDDVDRFFDEPMDIVIEVAGGKGQVSELVRRAMEHGSHIVTANKALLAAEGSELFALARKHDVSIGFEASCGGGIPCITSLLSGLMSNRIRGLYGILNGTCNYILTEMIAEGKSYEQALREAQEKGYAEADPTLDVGGGDTAQKLAILASLAFGVRIDEKQIRCHGIDKIELADVKAGMELGYDIKLLGIAQQNELDGPISISVEPCFIDHHALLAQVKGAFNALSVLGDAVGHALLYGQGAGQMPTASAVMSDVLNVTSGMYPIQFANMRLTPDGAQPAQILPEQSLRSRYYLRFNAMDKPGTIAKLTQVLGDRKISLSAVQQHEVAVGKHVPLVMITHEACQSDVYDALTMIEELDVIEGKPVILRIVDLPR